MRFLLSFALAISATAASITPPQGCISLGNPDSWADPFFMRGCGTAAYGDLSGYAAGRAAVFMMPLPQGEVPYLAYSYNVSFSTEPPFGFSDKVTITGGPGAGVARFFLDFDVKGCSWSTYAYGLPYPWPANWRTTASLTLEGVPTVSRDMSSAFGMPCVDTTLYGAVQPVGPAFVDYIFTYGQPFDLSAQLSGALWGYSRGELIARYRLSVGVYDESGNRLPLAIASESGTLYDASAPDTIQIPGVPEPGTFGPAALALATLLARHGWRRPRRTRRAGSA